ncbi:MAG: ImuA family protein [Tabrizicola sp.]
MRTYYPFRMSLPIHHLVAPRPQDLQPLAGDLALRRGRVHEFCGPSRVRLAAGVMARSDGPVVWIRPAWGAERLNAAGLQPLANPARLILVEAPRDEGLLWAMEEVLRSGAAPLVVAELTAPPGLTPIRRLHLAAAAGGEAAGRDGAHPPLGLILLPGEGGAPGVESRWHLAPAPSPALLWSDEARWTLTRLRARLAPPAAWRLARRDGDEVLEPLPSAS